VINRYINEVYFAGGEREVGGALLHHLELTQFNCHEVSELVYEGSNVEGGKTKFIGGAIYPRLALFNHSCNPSILRYLSFHHFGLTSRSYVMKDKPLGALPQRNT
jgi:hypothetical protein